MSGCGCACPVDVVVQEQVAVSVVEAVALDANKERVNASVQNFGSQAVFLYFTTAQGLTAPVMLMQGQVWEALQAGWIYTGPVYVVTGSSTSIVGVTEEEAA